MAQEKTTAFEKEGVIPDVLPPNTTLYGITVKWPSATLDEPGQELDREATQPEPTIHLVPLPQERHSDYTLIMTDPDLMARNDPNFGQVRHWLAVNVTVNEDGQLNIPKAANVSPYVGPAPLPNYISPRPHRYVFILSRPISRAPVTIQNEDFQALQRDYSAAFEGRQELQDLKDRWGFNAQKFLEMKGLRPEAATFMFVGGTLKSAADNIKMTAMAGVNKAREAVKL